MIEYDKSEPILSIHIPRCGGKSLTPWLAQMFPGKLHRHYFDEAKNRMPEKHKWQVDSCIHGHFNKTRGFGIQDYYPQARQFITILRDPFEVLVSRYYYEKQNARENRSFRWGRSLELDDHINTYLEKEIKKEHYHPNILDYLPGDFTIDNYKDQIQKYFIYVGILEDFQFSLDRLAVKLGNLPLKVERLNRAPRHPGIDPGLRENFKALHPLEYAIYHYAVAHYKSW